MLAYCRVGGGHASVFAALCVGLGSQAHGAWPPACCCAGAAAAPPAWRRTLPLPEPTLLLWHAATVCPTCAALPAALPQVPDRKQKGRVLGGAEHPERRVVDAVKQAMQLHPAAADALVKEIKGVTGVHPPLGVLWLCRWCCAVHVLAVWPNATCSIRSKFLTCWLAYLPVCLSACCCCLYFDFCEEPGSHRILDFWLLLAMLTLGADRRKAAEAILGWVLRADFLDCRPSPAGWMCMHACACSSAAVMAALGSPACHA